MTRSDMIRTAVACLALMLQITVADAAGTSKSVAVAGNLSGGAKVTASCTISSTGSASGAGRLYGTNTNGTSYSYPFLISRATTSNGRLVLSGAIMAAGSPPMSLSVTVPSGAQKLEYVVNGKTASYTGTGTVTVK